MDRALLVASAVLAAVAVCLAVLWTLRDYAVPVFVNGGGTATRIDTEIGSLIAARFPTVTLGPARCPAVLNLTAHRSARCVLPIGGGELPIDVAVDMHPGLPPSLEPAGALFVAQDAERAIGAILEERYGERFDVHCPGPAERIVDTTPPVCSVDAPDMLRRGIEITATGYAGAVNPERFGGVATRAERVLGRDVAERLEGSVVVAGSAMERYVRGSASAEGLGEVGRRGLVGDARCPARIALREGSHTACTVRVGGLPLEYDVHFEKGLGLRADAAHHVAVVAVLREIATRFFERPEYTRGKPLQARVECGSSAVAFADPGSSLPCTADVDAERFEFAVQIVDANGDFKIVGR